MSIVKTVKVQDRAVFELEDLTETALGDGIKDGVFDRATASGGILREGVIGGEDDIDSDPTLWSITVVLKLEPVSMERLLGVGVVSYGRSEGGQSKAGSLEIHKSLKGSRRLGSLVGCESQRPANKTSCRNTSLLLVTQPLTISGVNSSTKVLSCDVSVHSGPEETIPMLGPKRVSCFFGGLVASLGTVSLS